MLSTLLPNTAASTVQPVSAAMAWAAVTVSHETRLSLPSRCSTTTRIEFAILFFPPALFEEPHRKKQKRDGHIYAKDYLHEHVTGTAVPAYEQCPSCSRNQHDYAQTINVEPVSCLVTGR